MRTIAHISALIFSAIFAAFVLSSCSSSAPATPQTETSSSASSKTPDAAPVSVEGKWKADGFSAVVTDKTITINIVDGATRSLYWKGTFKDATGEITSKADVEALDASMMGSQDKTKVFVHENNELSFEMTMMGTTTTITMTKE